MYFLLLDFGLSHMTDYGDRLLANMMQTGPSPLELLPGEDMASGPLVLGGQLALSVCRRTKKTCLSSHATEGLLLAKQQHCGAC